MRVLGIVPGFFVFYLKLLANGVIGSGLLLVRMVYDDDTRHQRYKGQHDRAGSENSPTCRGNTRQKGDNDEDIEWDAEKG